MKTCKRKKKGPPSDAKRGVGPFHGERGDRMLFSDPNHTQRKVTTTTERVEREM